MEGDGAVLPSDGVPSLEVVGFLEAGPAAGETRWLRDIIENARGEVVEVRGSLVVASFSSAQACLGSTKGLLGRVRGGVSCGDVIRERGLLHGLPVVEASRLREVAEPGQILCAKRLLRLLGPASVECGPPVRLTLKGVPGPFTCYALRGESL